MSMDSLMRKIAHLKTEPAIFQVLVRASDHQDGFESWADFRTCTEHAVRSVSTHGDTPEQALTRLLTILEDKWISCPHCHRPLAL